MKPDSPCSNMHGLFRSLRDLGRKASTSWFKATYLLGSVSAILVLLMALPLAYNAVLRKVGHPTDWTFDAGLYMLSMAAFLAAPHALETGHHFRITFLVERFPKVGRYLEIISSMIVMVFGIFLAVAGGQLAYSSLINNTRSISPMEVPLFWPQLVVPLAGVAIAVEALLLSFRTDRIVHRQVE